MDFALPISLFCGENQSSDLREEVRLSKNEKPAENEGSPWQT